VTGRLDLSKDMALSIPSGRAHLALGELYPWIASFDGIRERGKEIRSLRGVADVGPLSLAGPLGGAGEWTFDAAGALSGLELDTPLLPGPLSVPTGRFRIRPDSATFSGVEATLLDAIVRGSVEFRSSGGGVSQATGSSLEGEVGKEAIRWASSLLQVPPEFVLRAPLSATAAGFSWEKEGPVFFKGEFHRPGGAALSFSLRQTPEELAIDSLLRDPESAARLTLHLVPKSVRLNYKGTLYRSTVEKFVAIPADPFRYLKGDLSLSVDRERLGRTEANGTLEGEGIRIPWTPLDPLLIRSASLSAEGKKIRVISSDLAWREIPFRLRGEGSFSGDGLVADVDVETGDVPLERLLPQPPRGSAETAADSGGPPVTDAGYHLPKLPVRGFLRLRSDSIRYGRWTVNSVTARGELGPEALHVAVSGGDLCGFPLHLSATLDPKGLAVELRTSASGGDLNQPLVCLTDQRVAMTGSFQFATRLSARGRDKESLLRSIEGPVEFTARDGRIHQWAFLSNILAVLNVTNVIRGQFPDLRQEGLPYKTLRIRGEYWAEVLLVKEGTLWGPTLGIAWNGEIFLWNSEMDIKVLASPFRTADWIIRNLPWVGYIMGKTLVSVPLKVKGDFHDPSVSFDPVGAGSGLLGVLERAITLPVKIIRDILPKPEPPK